MSSDPDASSGPGSELPQARAPSQTRPSPTPSARSVPQIQRPSYQPQFIGRSKYILSRFKTEHRSVAGEPLPSSPATPLLAPTATPFTNSASEAKPAASNQHVRDRLLKSIDKSSFISMKMPVAPSATADPLAANSTGAIRPPLIQPATVHSTPPLQKPKAKPSGGMSIIQRVNAGLFGRSATKAPSSDSKVKKSRAAPATKRRRAKRARSSGSGGDTSSASDLSEFDDVDKSSAGAGGAAGFAAGSLAAPPPLGPLLTTKSGRHVQKPTTYNPAAFEAAEAAARKQRGGGHGNGNGHGHGAGGSGKRQEQSALCRLCSRMHSPASNQIVFCDGCNDGWHQMCHDPWIEDTVVKGSNQAWFCKACQAKRGRHFGMANTAGGGASSRTGASGAGTPTNSKKLHKLVTTNAAAVATAATASPVSGSGIGCGDVGGASWSTKTSSQKRAHLTSLTHAELVGLLMMSVELHPDLPLFPSQQGGNQTTTPPHAPALGKGGRGAPAAAAAAAAGVVKHNNDPGEGALAGRENGQPPDELDEFDTDPLFASWPKAGKGLYSRLPAELTDTKHLTDDDDFESFSVVIFSDRGRKMMENGMAV